MIAVAGVFRAGPMWRYWGVYPAASGFFSAVTLLITWTVNNQVRVLKYWWGVEGVRDEKVLTDGITGIGCEEGNGCGDTEYHWSVVV